MAGVQLSEFNDFVEATGPTYVTGPNYLVNEAVKHAYYVGHLMRGDANIKKMIQGGADIRENLVFKDNGTFETYLPGVNHDWENPQRLQKIKAFWRYTLVHMSWVEQEILLNSQVKYGGDDARFQAYVDIRNEKETIMWAAKWNGLENLLWATPDTAQQEAEGGKEPYPITAFINQDTNGLWGSGWGTAPDLGAWTTVEGLTPGDADLDGKFAPQQIAYSNVTADDPSNIVSKMDEMVMDIYFERPATHREYFEDPRLNQQMILTTKAGRQKYMVLIRQGQDHYVAGAQDPAYTDPQFAGIPIRRVDTLETAALYEPASGNTPQTELNAAADITGPRYYFVNGNYLYPVCHEDRYFYKHEVTKHHNVPDTWVCPVATWYNVICTSRQRQGILYPDTDIAA